ncbi:MAG: hypothetical protein AB1489_22375, partial [Acidobacteriota bacterium]
IMGLVKSGRTAPKTRSEMLQQIERLIEQNNLLTALQHYKKLFEAEPDNMASAARLSEIYLLAGQRQDAEQLSLLIAERCAEDGLVPQAMLMYQRANRFNPANIDAGLRLANLCADQGCDALAIQQCERIIDYASQVNLTEGALKALELAVRLQPRNPSLQQRLATIYIALNQKQAALKCLQIAGEELMAQGQAALAREIYETMLTIKPFHQTALAILGHIYLDEGENEKAIEMLVPSCQSDPANVELLASLGRAFLNSDRLEEADQTLTTLFKLDKTCYGFLLELSGKYLARGDLEHSGQVIEKCIYSLIARGKEQHAVVILENCLAQDPSHLPSLKRLIDVYLFVRDNNNLCLTLERLVAAALVHNEVAEAKTALRQLINLAPQNTTYLTQLRELEEWVANNPQVPVPPSIRRRSLSGLRGDRFVLRLDPESFPPEVSLEEKLQDVDFYCQQGYLDVAYDTLMALQEQYPTHTELTVRLDQIRAQMADYSDPQG